MNWDFTAATAEEDFLPAKDAKKENKESARE
jgi:hypothetical protein